MAFLFFVFPIIESRVGWKNSNPNCSALMRALYGIRSEMMKTFLSARQQLSLQLHFGYSADGSAAKTRTFLELIKQSPGRCELNVQFYGYFLSLLSQHGILNWLVLYNVLFCLKRCRSNDSVLRRQNHWRIWRIRLKKL